MAGQATSLCRYPKESDLVAFRIPSNCFVKLHAGTWHAGPLFPEPDNMSFYNLELADTNVVDHNTHKYSKDGIVYELQEQWRIWIQLRSLPSATPWRQPVLHSESSPYELLEKVCDEYYPLRNDACAWLECAVVKYLHQSCDCLTALIDNLCVTLQSVPYWSTVYWYIRDVSLRASFEISSGWGWSERIVGLCQQFLAFLVIHCEIQTMAATDAPSTIILTRSSFWNSDQYAVSQLSIFSSADKAYYQVSAFFPWIYFQAKHILAMKKCQHGLRMDMNSHWQLKTRGVSTSNYVLPDTPFWYCL